MSYETERLALSSLMRGGWGLGGHALSEDDFLEPEHRDIFRAVKEIETKGHDADMFAVQARVSFPIDEIANLHVGGKRIQFLADELRDESLKRSVQGVCGEVLAGDGTGREQLLRAQTLLAGLDGKAGCEATLLADHVGPWWEEMGARSESGDWLNTGFSDVDRRLGGLRPGNLFILAARPGMGKTALALNIARQCGKTVALFSLEMMPDELIDRMAAYEGGVSLQSIRNGNLSDDEWGRLTQASKAVSQFPIHLDTSSGITIEEIHSRARSVKARHGLDFVIVDYLQLIKQTHKSIYESVTHISKASKRMAKDLQVPVLMLSQLNREVDKRKEGRPVLSDLRESGSIEQDADVVAFIYRDEVYNENSPHRGVAELIFKKVRQGQPGTDWLNFAGSFQRFTQGFKPKEELKAISGPGY